MPTTSMLSKSRRGLPKVTPCEPATGGVAAFAGLPCAEDAMPADRRAVAKAMFAGIGGASGYLDAGLMASTTLSSRKQSRLSSASSIGETRVTTAPISTRKASSVTSAWATRTPSRDAMRPAR